MNKVLPFVFLLQTFASCAFHNTAAHGDVRVGSNSNAVHVTSTTNVGLNAAVVVPLLRSTNIDRTVNDLTAEIAKENGDKVRLVETDAEISWDGFPPFTGVIYPVPIYPSFRAAPDAITSQSHGRFHPTLVPSCACSLMLSFPLTHLPEMKRRCVKSQEQLTGIPRGLDRIKLKATLRRGGAQRNQR